MVSRDDAAIHKSPRVCITYIPTRAIGRGYAQREVEIAIVERTVSSHRYLVTAHESADRIRIECVAQDIEILLQSISFSQVSAKSSDGYVGNRMKFGERDPVSFP